MVIISEEQSMTMDSSSLNKFYSMNGGFFISLLADASILILNTPSN